MKTLSNLPLGNCQVCISLGSFLPHMFNDEVEHNEHAGNLSIATTQMNYEHVGNLPIDRIQVEHDVYVGNLSPGTTDENLRTEFSRYGSVVHAYVVKAADGTPKGYGFVKFHSPESGLNAISALDGKMVAVNIWRVNKVYRKRKYEHEQEIREAMDKGVVLYVSNLHKGMKEKELHAVFCKFGEVITCGIRRNQDGIS